MRAQQRGAAGPVVVINDGDSVDLTHSITSGRTVQQLIYNTDTWQPHPPHPHLSTQPGQQRGALGGPWRHMGLIVSFSALQRRHT